MSLARIAFALMPISILVIWGYSCAYSIFGTGVFNHQAMGYGLEPGAVMLGFSHRMAVSKFQGLTFKTRKLQPLTKYSFLLKESLTQWKSTRRRLRLSNRDSIPLGYFLIASLVVVAVFEGGRWWRVKRLNETRFP